MDARNALSFGFWVKLAGVAVLVAIAGLIVLLIVTRAFFAWGFFGVSIVLLAVMLVITWFRDRREIRRYEDTR
jgi:heme exporter protein D